MGQIEIYEFLKAQRMGGCEDYFSASEIYKALQDQDLPACNKNNVYVSLIQLERFEYLEVKMNGKFRDWKRLYRIKKIYCEAIISDVLV